MSSTILPISRKAARIVLMMCLLAMAWYGYYQVEAYLWLFLVQFSQALG